MNKLFVYGTLIQPEIQQMILGKTVEAEEDTLPDYEMGSLCQYKAILPKKGESVDGWVLEIDDDQLKKVDTYENGLYKRVLVNTKKNKNVYTYEKKV